MTDAYEIARKLMKYLNENPENVCGDGTPNWDYVTADLYIDGYDGPDELVDDAIDLIVEAAVRLQNQPVYH